VIPKVYSAVEMFLCRKGRKCYSLFKNKRRWSSMLLWLSHWWLAENLHRTSFHKINVFFGITRKQIFCKWLVCVFTVVLLSL